MATYTITVSTMERLTTFSTMPEVTIFELDANVTYETRINPNINKLNRERTFGNEL